MEEVVNTLHPLTSNGDVIKHQVVNQTVLHPPEHLLLAKDACGGDGDVLECYPVDVSRFSPSKVRI